MNATQAAIRAKDSANTAGSVGQENLKKPEIQKAIQRAMEERTPRHSRRLKKEKRSMVSFLHSAKTGYENLRKPYIQKYAENLLLALARVTEARSIRS